MRSRAIYLVSLRREPIRRLSTTAAKKPEAPIVLPSEYKPPTPEEWALIDEGNAWHEALKEKLRIIRQGGDSIQNRSVYYKDDDVVVCAAYRIFRIVPLLHYFLHIATSLFHLTMKAILVILSHT